MRRHLTYANVISSICLFVVLGGSAYAATLITGKQVKDNSLTSADIRNGTLRAADFKRGVLRGAAVAAGPRGEAGQPGPKGEKGDPGPGAVPISLLLQEGDFQAHPIDIGPLTIAANCSAREGRPQVQIFGYTTGPEANGTLQWTGIRSNSTEGEFVTAGGTDVDPGFRGLDSRWAPAGGWAGEGLDIQYRSGSKAATVSLHMMADDRGSTGKCTVAGTAVAAG